MLLAGCSVTPRAPPPSTDIDEDAYRADVRRLASDEFEGRRPGTVGEDKTAAFLVARFRALGLKPGNGDSFLQAVPLLEAQPTSAPTLTIAAAAPAGAVRPLVFGKDMVVWTQRRTPEVTLASSELVFVGYGIVAPEYDWNDYAGIDVHGKTVVVLLSDPGAVGADSKLFRGRSLSYYGYPTYKLEEAARQGASGVLLIHEADVVGYPWDAVVNTYGGVRLQLAAEPTGPRQPEIEGWLEGTAARSLFAAASLDYKALRAAAARPGFKAVSMGLRADATLHQTLRNFNSVNVVAVLPGSKRRHDYILYSAHWDHLGRAALGGDIYPGAVDDATGVAGLLQLAQSFRRTKPPPERSIVFIAFTGEEDGLLGSQYYVDNPLFPLADTVADLNLDRLHVGGPTRDVTDIAFGQSDLDAYLRDAATIQGRELHADPHPEAGEFFRSDDFSFAKAGVPALVAFGGDDDSARGPAFGAAQRADYYAHRWHRTSDAYAEDWDVRGAIEDLTLEYHLGMRLAQTRRFPNWAKTSDYRAARERSRESADD